MTTLILTSAPNTLRGLGCLNGLSCPDCKSPLIDTLSTITEDRKLNQAHCPVCQWEGTYNKFTKTIK